MIDFSWDEQKSKSNYTKHEISFEEARSVFLDDNARLITDPDHSGEEERFILLGMSHRLNILVVVHCYKENENKIRIISARKATRNEKNVYEEFLK